jgi:cytochrome d ubiquinol oxidase subunit I
MNCHTVEGYRSLRALLHGRDRKSIANMITMLHDAPATSPYKNYMPPLVGTKEEVEALVGYLDNLENKPAVVAAK